MGLTYRIGMADGDGKSLWFQITDFHGRGASTAHASKFKTISQVFHPVRGFICVPFRAAIAELAVAFFLKVHGNLLICWQIQDPNP
jgi:hypothetical protein